MSRGDIAQDGGRLGSTVAGLGALLKGGQGHAAERWGPEKRERQTGYSPQGDVPRSGQASRAPRRCHLPRLLLGEKGRRMVPVLPQVSVGPQLSRRSVLGHSTLDLQVPLGPEVTVQSALCPRLSSKQPGPASPSLPPPTWGWPRAETHGRPSTRWAGPSLTARGGPRVQDTQTRGQAG